MGDGRRQGRLAQTQRLGERSERARCGLVGSRGGEPAAGKQKRYYHQAQHHNSRDRNKGASSRREDGKGLAGQDCVGASSAGRGAMRPSSQLTAKPAYPVTYN